MKRFFIGLFFLLAPLAALAQSETYFEVETLNAGLPDVPETLDLLTPQTAVAAFLEAIDADNFNAAAHVLNLNDYPIALQRELGPRLAEQLGTVIERKLVINWQALLERPDSLDANASNDSPMAGQSRRSLLLGILELNNRSVAIRLNRLQLPDGDAYWVFSRQTVNNIPALFDRYGPSEIEKALPDWARGKGPLGLFWWEFIALPLLVLVTGAVALLTWRGINSVTNTGSTAILNNVLLGLRLPLTLAMLGLTIWAVTNNLFVLSGIISSILDPLVVILIVTALMVLLINMVDAIIARIIVNDVHELASPDEEERRATATTAFAIRRFIVVIAVLLGAGITMTNAKVFESFGVTLLAAAGGLTLMLGFAAREVLGNILASLQISLNRSARIGDQLIFEDKLCVVERIHFSFVQLKVWDDTRLVVPVSEFVSESFINRTLIDNNMTRAVILRLAPTIDIEAMRAHYFEWVQNDDRVVGEDKFECLVVGQSEYGIDIRFCAPIDDPRDGWDVECELRESLINYAKSLGHEALPHLGSQNTTKEEDEGAASDEA